MTSKEALEQLKYYTACCRCQYFIDNKCTNKDDCVYKTIEKDLEVLEIIKEKEVNMAWLTYISSVEEYNKGKFIGSYLTETEFNLIKKWLEK